MCLIFTCGEHTFRKEVEGYEGIVCRCHNCGNYSASVIKSHPWFTFCFVVCFSRHPSFHEGLRRCQLPGVQLFAAAFAPAGCSADARGRGAGDTDAASASRAGESRMGTWATAA
ncbi:uncharacterized protein PODANS_1_3170 [Podospora anserina S mat+]|uniref:Podospora anserina S mat+ genomic DNA chromosome 1, supercontig 1 n=1 Tax=Podospora anserina (strain S / ATCC MYA-4624 / DSM 980 / FGSC 10383) TaxID=515849 RepID=B2AA83_PODAN|nr:uncharacterized protein PODANS_1_3170 [Podospora anserina S mat+]CAP59995.1 unnamed protein product [Podospora anserina S mat+]